MEVGRPRIGAGDRMTIFEELLLFFLESLCAREEGSCEEGAELLAFLLGLLFLPGVGPAGVERNISWDPGRLGLEEEGAGWW